MNWVELDVTVDEEIAQYYSNYKGKQLTLGIIPLKNKQHFIDLEQEGDLENDAQNFAKEVLGWTGNFISYIPCEYIFSPEMPIESYVVLQAPYAAIWHLNMPWLETLAGMEKYSENSQFPIGYYFNHDEECKRPKDKEGNP